MWPRVVEVMLAIWLALSPFIFQQTSDNPPPWLLYGLALLIATLALLSYWPRARRAHLGILVVAIGMALWGRFAHPSPPPAGYQNLIALGFLLMMFAIIPSDCLRPPQVWRDPDAVANGDVG